MSGRPDPVLLRERMVLRDVVGRGVRDQRVIAAFLAVPRHLFVEEALQARAYLDQALPIGAGQTISRASTVALMTELLACEPEHRVLEIGTGSGYQAAVLARLCRHVDTVERLPALAKRARLTLEKLKVRNVRVHQSDGTLGLRGRSFPRIIVTAMAPGLPDALFDQLEEGGRLVLPVQDASGEDRIELVEKRGGARVVRRAAPASFVPLIGQQGFTDRDPSPS